MVSAVTIDAQTNGVKRFAIRWDFQAKKIHDVAGASPFHRSHELLAESLSASNCSKSIRFMYLNQEIKVTKIVFYVGLTDIPQTELKLKLLNWTPGLPVKLADATLISSSRLSHVCSHAQGFAQLSSAQLTRLVFLWALAVCRGSKIAANRSGHRKCLDVLLQQGTPLS